MEATVKPTHRWNTVMAFSGFEYVKGEYRPVPAGFEAQAKNHPLLDTRESTKKAATKKESTGAGNPMTGEEKKAFAEKMRLAREAAKAKKVADQAAAGKAG
jgi:hypothetical protein